MPFSNNYPHASASYKFYATIGSNVNLLTDDPGNKTGREDDGRPCREIHVFGTGNLDVTRPDGTDVDVDAVPAGWVLPIQAKTLRSTGTATNVLVLW